MPSLWNKALLAETHATGSVPASAKENENTKTPKFDFGDINGAQDDKADSVPAPPKEKENIKNSSSSAI